MAYARKGKKERGPAVRDDADAIEVGRRQRLAIYRQFGAG